MSSDEGVYTSLKNNIIQCLKDQEQSLNLFKDQIRNKDVTMFLGCARSGKSTLVNYLLDNELEAWEERKKVFKVRTRTRTRNCNGPEIGQGSLSCTAMPGAYAMPGNTDKVIVDAPGFEDNRGVVQDIMNALCISQIKVARTVKFVLVFDINDITNDNIGHFIHSLQQTQSLVSNIDELKNSFCILFTKDFMEYTQNEIVELLQNKVLNVEKLDMDKVLMNNCTRNRQLIGIFRMPTVAGNVSAELDVNVKGAIAECPHVDVQKCQILFAISSNAQEVLLQIYPKYTDSNFFKEHVNNITARFNNYFNVDKWVYASYEEELRTAKQSLENIANSLRYQINKLKNLNQIQVSLDRLLEHPTPAEFKENFKFAIMLDSSGLLEEKYKKMIITNYNNSLRVLCRKVNSLLSKICNEMEEREKNKIVFVAAGGACVTGMIPAITGTAKMMDMCIKSNKNVLSKVVQPGADKILDGYIKSAEGVISKVVQPGAAKSLVGCVKSTGEVLSIIRPGAARILDGCVKSAESLLSKVVRPGVAAYSVAETAVGGATTASVCLAGVGLVGAGVGTAYVLYKEAYGKRYEARKAQGRRM